MAMEMMIDQLRELNTKTVLLKGGHLENQEYSTDLLIFPDYVESLSTKRVDTRNTHGTGCTLSSAIASYLAQGNELTQAVKLGKQYISEAIAHADELDIGQGHGPVNHFYNGHLNVR
jgi:hydroxymethylpyrimidine/phosphomethylpyrimidine kinase